MIDYPDGKKEFYEKDGKTLKSVKLPNGEKINYKNGKPIRD